MCMRFCKHVIVYEHQRQTDQIQEVESKKLHGKEDRDLYIGR
jgi:hypothetical protein